jgi:hypothetical protein
MRTEKIAETIKNLGFPVLSVSEPDDQFDGEVTISREVTVQVCSNSLDLIVNRFDGEAMHHSLPVINAIALASKINAALKEAKKHPAPEFN